MNLTMNEEIKRWTAKRKSALVNEILQGKTTVAEAGKSYLNSKTAEFIEQLDSTELVQAGSSLSFCLTAEGSADIAPRLASTCEWDTIVAHAVVEGVGRYIFDATGMQLGYGKPDVLNLSFIADAVSSGELNRTND